MRARQSVLIAVISVDVESAKAIHTLKLAKAVERHFACTCNKLQELGSFLLVKRSDCAPEPLNLWRRGLVVVIFGVIFPVVDIDIGQTRDEQFKLLLVEDCDQFRRHDVVKACWSLE